MVQSLFHTSPCIFRSILNMRSASSASAMQSSSQMRFAARHVCLHACGPHVSASSRLVFGVQPRGEVRAWPTYATIKEAHKSFVTSPTSCTGVRARRSIVPFCSATSEHVAAPEPAKVWAGKLCWL